MVGADRIIKIRNVDSEALYQLTRRNVFAILLINDRGAVIKVPGGEGVP